MAPIGIARVFVVSKKSPHIDRAATICLTPARLSVAAVDKCPFLVTESHGAAIASPAGRA
jgi:hypothetical protein